MEIILDWSHRAESVTTVFKTMHRIWHIFCKFIANVWHVPKVLVLSGLVICQVKHVSGSRSHKKTYNCLRTGSWKNTCPVLDQLLQSKKKKEKNVGSQSVSYAEHFSTSSIWIVYWSVELALLIKALYSDEDWEKTPFQNIIMEEKNLFC